MTLQARRRASVLVILPERPARLQTTPSKKYLDTAVRHRRRCSRWTPQMRITVSAQTPPRGNGGRVRAWGVFGRPRH